MHDKYIELTLKEAKKAFKKGEVPIGALIIKDNKVISKAYNMVEKKRNATYHAEILAIKKASKKIKNWRLNGCDMYVTLEPCGMCKSAIELCRIDNVYYFAKRDKKINVNNDKYKFIKEEENNSINLLQSFFKNRR